MTTQRKILVCDDSDVCRGLVCVALEERGYQVIELADGAELSKTVQREQPDLALVDVTMEALRGDDLIRDIQSDRSSRVPLVLFSGRSHDELAELATSCGAAGFVCKSDEVEVVVQRVEEILQRIDIGGRE